MRHDEPATMMHLIRPILLLLGVLLLMLIADFALADTVRIHGDSGSDGPEITLKQVAELDGEYANEFAGVVVGRFEQGEAKAQIETSHILEVMREAGASLGRLDLRGFGRCTVHRTFTEPAKVEKAPEEPAVTNIESRAGGKGVTVHSPTTVRALIEHSVAEAIGVGVDELKVTFNERDEQLLKSSAVAGRYEVEPEGVPTLGRQSFKVYAYRGTQRDGQARVVRIDVAQRVIAVVAAEPIERGKLIGRRQVRLREVLVDDVQQLYVTETALVIGQVASQKIDAGQTLTSGSVQMPTAVHRRERVRVELKTPGVKISFNGIAHDEGSVGDVIEVENPQTKQRFNATIVGRGKVVAGEVKQEKAEESQ